MTDCEEQSLLGMLKGIRSIYVTNEPATSPIFSDDFFYDEEEEEEPELEEEGEISLTSKRKVPDAKLPSNDSIEISQDVEEEGAEGDLPDLVPTTVKVRLDKKRKLILPADKSENENNQVVPPIQVTTVTVDPKETTKANTRIQSPGVNKEIPDQGPSKLGEGQSLALATKTTVESSTPTSQTT
ncbi:unnamed protein product [Prunus armeniaca]